MKNLTLTILIALHCSLFTIQSFSQSCLPEGITFTTQAEIDSFQINYPNCTEIEGDVTINGNNITNLNGLNVLTSIVGGLFIGFYDNGGVPLLTSLTGLENLAFIGGDLSILANGTLNSLTGLDNVTTIGGNLSISANHSLVSLEGLENLMSIGGNLILTHNDVLTSLEGLENINSNSINDIYIIRNNSLTNCTIQSICEYLQSPTGSVNIYNNASGCNNPPEIASAGGFTIPCLPFGNYHLVSQSEIDNFENDYPDCTEIEGNIEIKGTDIINLEGLHSITNIAGNLSFYFNVILTELNGLENLQSIGGNLDLGIFFDLPAGNQNLNSLTGLNNLSSIGGDLNLISNYSLTNLHGLEGLTSISGDLLMYGNNYLTNLSALSNMTTLGGDFKVDNNNALTSLTGMEWLTFILGDVSIYENQTLSNLTGLDNLTFIEGHLEIGGGSNMSSLSGLENLATIGGGLGISSRSLSNFSELNNLTSIGGGLGIYWNDALTSLSGLENIDANSISKLTIRYNQVLSTCEAQSICNFLAGPNGTIEIHDNAPGCNGQQEVEEACAQSVDEISVISKLSIHPNPFSNTVTIEFELRQPEIITITVYNYLGKKVEVIMESKSVGQQKIDWDCEGLQVGIYFCVIKTNKGMLTRKIIKL